MSTVSSPPARADTGVDEFLKRHGAEAEYQRICGLIHATFPEMRALETGLQEDPDEAGRVRAILHVVLPAAHPSALLMRQFSRFDESFLTQFPPSRRTLFVLLPDFEED